MTRLSSVSYFRPEFDDFLRASIEEGAEGTLLSVLSALARQGTDPWLEAANLARLPPEISVRRLAALIAALPQEAASSHRDTKAVATRLIALLPCEAGLGMPSHSASQGRTNPLASLRPGLLYVVMFFLAVMLAIQLFTADSTLPGHTGGMSAQAIGTSSPTNASKTISGNHGP